MGCVFREDLRWSARNGGAPQTADHSIGPGPGGRRLEKLAIGLRIGFCPGVYTANFQSRRRLSVERSSMQWRLRCPTQAASRTRCAPRGEVRLVLLEQRQ